jgi:heme/copper-type cytochrome/quinol oxidase subunit 2
MRLAIALITAAALVLLFVLVRPGGGNDETTTTAATTATTQMAPTSTEPTVQPVQPAAVVWQVNANESSIARKTVQKGARVTLVVTADHSEEVHVHGYDLKADVAPGKPAKIAFHADTPGRFEIELEHAGKQIAELTVEP